MRIVKNGKDYYYFYMSLKEGHKRFCVSKILDMWHVSKVLEGFEFGLMGKFKTKKDAVKFLKGLI